MEIQICLLDLEAGLGNKGEDMDNCENVRIRFRISKQTMLFFQKKVDISRFRFYIPVPGGRPAEDPGLLLLLPGRCMLESSRPDQKAVK